MLNEGSRINKAVGKGLGALKFAFGSRDRHRESGAACWLIEIGMSSARISAKAWDWICGKFKWAADFIKESLIGFFQSCRYHCEKMDRIRAFKRNGGRLEYEFRQLARQHGGRRGRHGSRTGNERGKESLESPPDRRP